MTDTSKNILSTLGYFDLFQYPLTKEEIRLFHAGHISPAHLDPELASLLEDRLVYRIDEFYSLRNDASLAQRRRMGNRLAVEQLNRATQVARLLASFPYVKGIAVSGSLSKNFANEKTDIDFFIITEANRLWITRTLMHLYKKLTFLTGRQNWFCMNYYVDEAAPEIAEKNIFTAMETVTLLPMQGKSSIDHFMTINAWAKEYFPAKKNSTAGTPEIRPGFIRRTVERIFNGQLGSRFDNWLMKVTENRWHKKAIRKQVNSNGVCMGMIVGQHVSKPDPRNFQDKVVERYRYKMRQLLKVNEPVESVAV